MTLVSIYNLKECVVTTIPFWYREDIIDSIKQGELALCTNLCTSVLYG